MIIPWIIGGSWAVFILYWIISSFGVKHDVDRSIWQRFWWVRVFVAFIVIGWLWGTSSLGKYTRHIGIFNPTSSGVLAGIGAVLSVLGIALAMWARMHLGRNWSPVPALKEEHELVTSGPYAFVRHPIYTGIMIAALGSTLASATWLVIFFIISAVFIWRVKTEEKLMMRQFPNQYPDYKKRTWALVPYIW